MKTKTKNPGKQRKRVHDSFPHQRHKLFSAPLSKELRKKFQRRSLPLRIGDKVKVVKGSLKGTEGEVVKADLKNIKLYVDKVVSKKRDGTEVLKPIAPSNLIITEIDIRDKSRQKVLERKVEKRVIEEELKREEEERKKEEERKRLEEEKKKAEEEAKKKAEEEAKRAEEAKKKAEAEKEKPKKKAAKKPRAEEEEKVSEKGIDKKMKKEWIKEK